MLPRVLCSGWLAALALHTGVECASCCCFRGVLVMLPGLLLDGRCSARSFCCCRDAQEIKNYHPTEDWGLCMNGTRNEGAVKGAVTDFAQRLGLTVAVTYREPDNPVSWGPGQSRKMHNVWLTVAVLSPATGNPGGA